MARYNAWMNARLYETCAAIPDADRKKDMGAFFRSIHGTLNHLLVGDTVWMGRFTGRPAAVTSLSQELYSDFAELRGVRRDMDLRISAWAGALTEHDLAGELAYTSIVNPAPRTMPMWIAVAHFFNHHTHHRGQLTTLIKQCGVDPGVTDLMWTPATLP